MDQEICEMKNNTKRILGRILARELSLEELGVVPAAATIVAARESFESEFSAAGDEPPVTTLIASLPDYNEDR